jgi:hypothetical protein
VCVCAVRVEMVGCGLQGELSAAIGQLTSLESLYVLNICLFGTHIEVESHKITNSVEAFPHRWVI